MNNLIEIIVNIYKNSKNLYAAGGLLEKSGITGDMIRTQQEQVKGRVGSYGGLYDEILEVEMLALDLAMALICTRHREMRGKDEVYKNAFYLLKGAHGTRGVNLGNESNGEKIWTKDELTRRAWYLEMDGTENWKRPRA